MPSMFISFPRAQFEKFFQNKLFPHSAVSCHTVLVVAGLATHTLVNIRVTDHVAR